MPKYILRQKLRRRMQTKNLVPWLSLTNLSHASQVGIFLLALFGYFYTVKPLYTKALLEENIAKYEMELPKLQRRNQELDNQAHASNEELIRISKLVNTEKEELQQLRKKLQESSILVANQAKAIANGKVELSNQYKSLRSTTLKVIKVNLETKCAFFLLNASITGILDSTLIETTRACLLNTLNEDTHMQSLLKEDQDEVIAQSKTISQKFARKGEEVLTEISLQEERNKSVRNEQEIERIHHQSVQIRLLMKELFEGIESISLSSASRL